ncbi:hypothetical protein [Phyllobacterium myrsinacearum]|uniref:Uncharacterized protein n=1 Tax=Phyllobacterium myrsinacearum TaxID=28101 RepID=A0A839ESC1_9HYPH|nr:hypothetical protein [Phyllobacterium myrsinacearum]MBA8881702.1 hypothetical protein [Phyllobacterium myrsinacearum]
MIQVYHDNRLVGHLHLPLRPGQRDIVFQNWEIPVDLPYPDDPVPTDITRTVYRLEPRRVRYVEDKFADISSRVSRDLRLLEFRAANCVPDDAEIVELRDDMAARTEIEFRWNALRADIDVFEELFDRDEFEPT